MPPTTNVSTTTAIYLAPAWVDLVLRDNFFFGEILGKTKTWDGSTMNFPKPLVSPYFSQVQVA